MRWRITFMIMLLIMGSLGALDLWAGPLATRIVDRHEDKKTVQLVAVAPRFFDTTGLLDFLDTMKDTYDHYPQLQVDIVRGRQRATLQAMIDDPQAWQARVLVRYRREGELSTMTLSPQVPGYPSR